MKRVLLSLALTFLANQPALAANEGFLGEWEVQTSVELMGMSMPGKSVKHCVTNDDLVMTPDVGENCELKNHTIKGNTITWHMTCTIEGQDAHIDGLASYVGDTMTSTININSMGITMVNHGTGKRLGPCK
ncbi:MAG: hypothetical protein AUK35_05715 [Zetaproteobacteria bacterium CG2_30_46_52]|nr:MAG: hypothetical protein AUK35_05715 [Zetaproteobacteria bacterium CG2_30_46_52]